MRLLKFLVVGMGVLIVAGTVALVVLIVQRSSGGAGSGSALPAMSLDLPAGSRILGIAGAGNHFAVHVQRPDGERILLLDSRSGRIVGEVTQGAAVPVR